MSGAQWVLSFVSAVLISATAVSIGVLGVWLWCQAEPIAMWLTRKRLEWQGYSREEAQAEVDAAAVRLGWKDDE